MVSPGIAVYDEDAVKDGDADDRDMSAAGIDGVVGEYITPPTCNRFNPSNAPSGPCTSCPAPKPPNSTSIGKLFGAGEVRVVETAPAMKSFFQFPSADPIPSPSSGLPNESVIESFTVNR